ncbi:hypothetical protein AARAC_010446 [Aspergillus arachidicola]|uniref:Uncharacterized protein n=1 Tax=Aspergillus arachidicola TaxID=656916 RepID=A0A2G7G3B7_9EURO|nr:hypothetical protein AARAC_010446 [Aspergillus arachidicola]
MSPFPDNDFAQVRPRLIVAWPRQQERLVRLLAPQNGANSSLRIQAVELDVGDPLVQVYTSSGSSKYPDVVVKGVLHIDSSATLNVPILGIGNATSIRSGCTPELRHRALESDTLSIFNIDLLWQDDSWVVWWDIFWTKSTDVFKP